MGDAAGWLPSPEGGDVIVPDVVVVGVGVVGVVVVVGGVVVGGGLPPWLGVGVVDPGFVGCVGVGGRLATTG